MRYTAPRLRGFQTTSGECETGSGASTGSLTDCINTGGTADSYCMTTGSAATVAALCQAGPANEVECSNGVGAKEPFACSNGPGYNTEKMCNDGSGATCGAGTSG